jgi:Uma2 family endonuclease
MSAMSKSSLETVPELESGDRLTLREFERRYEAMPDDRKAELIEGVVYVSSPVSIDHGEADGIIHVWLGAYVARHPDLQMLPNSTLRLDRDNEFQPDAILRRREGGASNPGERYLEGAPELVVEIAASSVSRDLHSKKHVYRRAGVREYLVWRVTDGELDWFELRDGDYVRREPGSDRVIESVQFAGLRLPVDAVLRGDVAAALAAVT